MDWQLLATIGMIHSLALISPGPDFALMVKIASQQTRQTALAAALGIAIAILVHTILSLTGVSLLIHSSPVLYTIVQLCGASYLGWMGIGALKSAFRIQEGASTLNETSPAISAISGFNRGLLTNLLNPKALVFFITLFSTLMTPSISFNTRIAAAVLLFTLSAAWFGLLAILLSKPKMQRKFQQFNRLVNGLIGFVFISVSSLILYQLIFL